MQHTTKMVMVPQDTYSSLMSQQKQIYSPVVGQLSNLDQELQSILNNPNLSTDAKYHQYMSVFGRFQSMKAQQFPTPVIVPEPTIFPVDEHRLIDSLPKNVRRTGRLLMEHLKENKDQIKWLKSGELVSDGQTIQGSNLTDLVHHITRNRPSKKSPVGATQFTELLKKTNAPQEAFHDQVTKQLNTIGTSFSPLSVADLFKTPMADNTLQKTPKRNRKQTQRWQAY
jgi:hypothetical protein